MCILLIDTNWLHVIVQPPYSKGCLTQYARSILLKKVQVNTILDMYSFIKKAKIQEQV